MNEFEPAAAMNKVGKLMNEMNCECIESTMETSDLGSLGACRNVMRALPMHFSSLITAEHVGFPFNSMQFN